MMLSTSLTAQSALLGSPGVPVGVAVAIAAPVPVGPPSPPVAQYIHFVPRLLTLIDVSAITPPEHRQYRSAVKETVVVIVSKVSV